jgi:anti-anti-sigma regulatory factor
VLLEVFREKGKDGFIICGVSDFVKETLEMVGYDQILSISDEGLS